ncbi:LETM1-related biofilm-associated protein [Dokdonia ponticola]|uniref:LETM1-related biofilm-associated protein n=1 Tax=Dokdonia ponticola TaxID=2041041 RepID=A0ABV9HXD6_9FLAO
MNPSALGWIKKHLPYFISFMKAHPMDEAEMYYQLRMNGFIYGTSIKTLCDEESEQLKWTEEEKTKVNLFDALTFTYFDCIENGSATDAIKSMISFYSELNKKQGGPPIQLGSSTDANYRILEKIIQERIQTNETLFKKNFSHIITNALLFIDVLSFDHYLISGEDPLPYAIDLEKNLTQIVWLALKQKENKDHYNELLIKLFESSIRYNTTIKSDARTLKDIQNAVVSQPLEQLYLLDLCALSLWDDEQIDPHEEVFMNEVSQILRIPNDSKEASLKAVATFISEHKEDIAYLNYSNPVMHFYNQTTRTVSTLILRNKKRLIKEITQSKDLVILLGNSTVRDLTEDEKKVVKNQLLDICKTVPSLAIFLLPGGTILLPILVKFIPKLLPSAFNENQMD